MSSPAQKGGIGRGVTIPVPERRNSGETKNALLMSLNKIDDPLLSLPKRAEVGRHYPFSPARGIGRGANLLMEIQRIKLDQDVGNLAQAKC